MLGLGYIVGEATLPDDCPRRRRARSLLAHAFAGWLLAVGGCIGFGFVLAACGAK